MTFKRLGTCRVYLFLPILLLTFLVLVFLLRLDSLCVA